MNNLDVIRAFANPKLPQNETTGGDRVKNTATYLAALESLSQSSEWLGDQQLVQHVVTRLEAIEPQSVEERAKTVAIYMKIINVDEKRRATNLSTIEIKISKQETISVPTRLLMAESPVLLQQLKKDPTQPIDLSKLGSEQTLAYFVSYLTTGSTAIINNGNAIALLLLANRFELTELSMKCIQHILSNYSYGNFSDVRGPLEIGPPFSEEEKSLRRLLKEANACAISIHYPDTGAPHIKMGKGDKKKHWDCLKKLHAIVPVTHLKLDRRKDLAQLLDFAKFNPHIVSLNLGESSNLNDANLQALSMHLPHIHSFSVTSAEIHIIPSAISNRVTTLECYSCAYLERINAPNATTLTCYNCTGLKAINAPKATQVDCSSCWALAYLNAPAALFLDCRCCDTLTNVTAPEATIIQCYKCRNLKSINAPNATNIDCNSSQALTTIEAAKAKSIDCRHCPSLASVHAPHVETINCRNCPDLPDESKSTLFNTMRRNRILTFYSNRDRLTRSLNNLFTDAYDNYGLDNPLNDPINRWFKETKKLVVPPDFNSEEEKSTWEERVKTLQQRLVAMASKESTLQGSDLSWFNNLKSIHNPQQQLNRASWLWKILACSMPGENPLTDASAVTTLATIGDIADPFLQAGATCALLWIYFADASSQREMWKQLKQNRPDHLLLPSLFFARTQINIGIADQLLQGLEARYYKDFNRLNPILEMAYMLSQCPSLSASEREVILTLVLKAPEKKQREARPAFTKRIETYRREQAKWVTACRDLMLFERENDLKGLRTVEDLLEVHKRACQAIFGVKEELLHSLINTFKSRRYPNGLFTYAARLQTLPDDEKSISTELLGEFVNGYLEGNFPGSRYDLTANKHLERIFNDNQPLFEIWKEPFDIDLAHTALVEQNPNTAQADIVSRLMKLAVDNKHLCGNQEELFPVLTRAVQANNPREAQAALLESKELLSSLQDLLRTASGRKQQQLIMAQQNLKIEICCLKALDVDAENDIRRKHLSDLLKILPDGQEFKNDVRGMLDALDPSKQQKAKWVKLQTTDQWEDLLLMGTDVNNSCQRIDGDPKYNKCLLAYILDGKNKLMIVRDSKGKIAARSVLRILWDSKRNCPVLFMERIYTKTADPALDQLIKQGCVKKAQQMGLTLVASNRDFPELPLYTGALNALGGPAPYEYVDALSGIQKDGIYSIRTSSVIYTPPI